MRGGVRTLEEALGLARTLLSERAYMGLADTVAAVEHYRICDGHFPETLADLVSSFMDSVLLDPFDGAPLRYCFTETGCTVYSVSMDLEDNGGTPLGRYRSWNTSGDQLIAVRDSKYRAAMAHNAQGQNER